GELDVVVLYREAVNYALVHNRVSPIAAIRVKNNGLSPIAEVTLAIEIDTPPAVAESPVGAPLEIPVGTVEADDQIEVPLHQLAWRLNPAPFVALDEPVFTSIHLTVRTGSDAQFPAVR